MYKLLSGAKKETVHFKQFSHTSVCLFIVLTVKSYLSTVVNYVNKSKTRRKIKTKNCHSKKTTLIGCRFFSSIEIKYSWLHFLKFQ